MQTGRILVPALASCARRTSYVVIVILVLGGCRAHEPAAPTPVAAPRIDDTWLRAVSTPVIHQRDEADCGLAVLAMLAAAWGRQWSLSDLTTALPPSSRGVTLGAMRDLARARGLEAYALRAGPGDLARELRYGRPVVLGLVLPVDRGRHRSHYEIAIAMNPRDGTVVTIDPATGRERWRTPDRLDAVWRPADYAALVVIADHERAARMADELLRHHLERHPHDEFD